MKIGKIIKSDSHFNYKCRIFSNNETENNLTGDDFYFGQFVKSYISEKKQAIGIIYNSQLFNPDYSNFGQKAGSIEQNIVTIPDYIDETSIFLDLMMIGWNEDDEYHQDITPWVLPLNSEVYQMETDEIIKFHYNNNNNLNINYINSLLTHTGIFAPQLLMNIFNFLENNIDKKEKVKLELLKQHILWQQADMRVKV